MQKLAIVVDDSRVARMTLKKLLLVDGFEVVEFGSGEEVLDYLADVDSNPDIIFMDVMMEGMDGLTATQKLKENPRLRTIPVVMCTGNDTAEDRQKALDVGAVTALSKPPVAEALASILSDIHSVEEIKPAEVAAPASVVDDELINKLRSQLEQQLNDMIENVVAKQIHVQIEQREVQLTEQITTKAISIIESSAADAFKVAAEENVTDIAVTTIQAIVEEANLPKQVSDFLAQEGEEWLTNQEEELGTQLSAQLEQHIPQMVTEHLNSHLESVITPFVEKQLESHSSDAAPVSATPNLTARDVEQIITKSLHSYTPTVVEPMVSSEIRAHLAEQEKSNTESSDELVKLHQQVSGLRNTVIALGLVVVGLIATMVI